MQWEQPAGDLAHPASAGAARERHSDALDTWLSQLFADAMAAAGLPGRTRGAHAGSEASGIALAAVGSLGRRDLGPHSDLDLVILHDGKVLNAPALQTFCDAVWYPIWDAHLRLDHAVRTVAQCVDTARGDVIAAVSLLDLRLIAGDAALVERTRTAVYEVWRRGARVQTERLVASLTEREASAGDIATTSEPDLKAARGGLRDAINLAALTATWLADRPRGAVDEAHAFLLRVRDAVHCVTGRPTNRLLRADRADVAALCGFSDVDDLLTEVSAAGRVIAYALDTTVRRVQRANPKARRFSQGFGSARRPTLNRLGDGFVEQAGEISRDAATARRGDPMLGLRAAALAVRHGLIISPQTLDDAANAPDLPEPWPAKARALLLEILAAGPALIPLWEALDQHGVIARWFPEWQGVRNWPHHSPVHRFTVDRHCIEAVAAAAALTHTVTRPDILLFATLMHDIGKRRGQRDHSADGAPLAAAVARRVGFDADAVLCIELLVREHLTLAEFATRRDPADPTTRAELAEAVRWRPDLLDQLRALSEADARGTGGQGWSPWRGHLLDDLVGRVRQDIANHGS